MVGHLPKEGAVWFGATFFFFHLSLPLGASSLKTKSSLRARSFGVEYAERLCFSLVPELELDLSRVGLISHHLISMCSSYLKFEH